MHRSRRTASPVRLSLRDARGGDIDGAWWPDNTSIARQLPNLIQALHPTLGEIVDIDINWSANSPTPILSTMSPDVAAKLAGSAPQHRLMFLTSRCAVTKLLVVPAMTSSPLALMVLRQAGDRHIPEPEHASREYQAAERVLCAARSESALWAATRAPAAPFVTKD